MKFFKVFIIIFILNLSLDIYLNNVKEFSQFRLFSKPLITILLAVFFYINSYTMQSRHRLLILGALLSLCIGDTILLEGMPFYSFILGLALFLVAMLCYSLYFYKQVRYDIDRLIPFLAASLLISLSMIYLIFDSLNNLLIPVILYMATVLNFLKLAYLRYKNVNSLSYRLVFIGVILFTAAQILIALNRFHQTLPYKDTAIMSLYGISQLLIILGILSFKAQKESNPQEDSFLMQ
ncbi:lysoplasmalogenase [Kordia sp.]|uniref:lysoplasmalogenase n=1 Tax=Kordia sp. TaxID=1965332 RepID=UPI003D6A577B